MRVNVLKTALVALLLHGVFTVAVPYSILRLTATAGAFPVGFSVLDHAGRQNSEIWILAR